MTGSRPAVAASSTAGTAEMIGPMIGSSSRIPADHRQQHRVPPEHRIDQPAEDQQPDEREHADGQAEDELGADPLPEQPTRRS